MASKGTSRYSRGGRIQQREIAERAGVSASTVSRVLNNIPGISVAVQDRVRTAALDLGYLNAAEPISTMVRKVGLFTHLAPHARSIDTFHSDIISGIEAECRRLGINLSLTILEGHNPDARTVLDYTQTHVADGLLFLSVDNETIIQRVLEQGHRFVVVNSEYPELPVDMFLPDNTIGVQRAIHLLIERGHRRILHYTSLHRRTFHLRLAAYRAALDEAGIPFDPDLVIDAPLDPEAGRKTILERLTRAEVDFTAIFCANDTTAIGIMRGIQEAGLRIPDDISIIGCDDIPMAAYVTPPLTTIRIEREELGALAVRRLVDRVAFPKLTPILVKMATQVIVRQSIGPARPVVSSQ
jgi:DNA-binding LacI/PurR family transcriptional regulator